MSIAEENLTPEPEICSSFFADLLAGNQPQMAGFRNWLFKPGMEFGARETWWGARKPRPAPHEGIDLYCFADAAGRIRQLDAATRIPATFAGTIARISRDFLGQSIFLRHEIFAADGRQLITAYGHTRPLAELALGQTVAAGEIIGAIAAGPDKNPKIPGHLHITLAWVSASLPSAGLSWKNLGAGRNITLIDPLTILSDPAP